MPIRQQWKSFYATDVDEEISECKKIYKIKNNLENMSISRMKVKKMDII